VFVSDESTFTTQEAKQVCPKETLRKDHPSLYTAGCKASNTLDDLGLHVIKWH